MEEKEQNLIPPSCAALNICEGSREIEREREREREREKERLLKFGGSCFHLAMAAE
jgi:hypothetical protein